VRSSTAPSGAPAANASVNPRSDEIPVPRMDASLPRRSAQPGHTSSLPAEWIRHTRSLCTG
jgi:hypothetical protein